MRTVTDRNRHLREAVDEIRRLLPLEQGLTPEFRIQVEKLLALAAPRRPEPRPAATPPPVRGPYDAANGPPMSLQEEPDRIIVTIDHLWQTARQRLAKDAHRSGWGVGEINGTLYLEVALPEDDDHGRGLLQADREGVAQAG